MRPTVLHGFGLAVVSITLFFLLNAWAYETVTIEEAIQKALKNNNYVKSRSYGLMANKEEFKSATSLFFPRLSFVERYTRGDYPSYAVFTKLNQGNLTFSNFFQPGTVSNFYTGISAEMPLLVPELFVTRNMKEASFLSRTKEFERFREEIAFTVFTTCLTVLKSKAVAEMATRSVDEARELFRVAKAKVSRGMGLHSDELRAFVYLKEREAFLIKSENDLHISRMAVSLLLSDDQLYDVVPLDSPRWTQLPPLEDALTQSLRNRADYLSEEYQAKSASHNTSLQRSRFLPKLSAGGTYGRDSERNPFGADGDGWMAGVSLRWEIFDKTQFDDMDKARYEEMRSKEYLAQKKREIAFQINEGYRRVDEAKKRVDVANEAMLQAEESFRLIRVRYENNLSAMVELLDAEVALVTARSNAIVSQNDYNESIGRALFNAGLLLTRLPETR